MSRPRTYDEQDVLERAMHQFWTQGYADTSISDLENATGVGRKSLYNAFGDKKALFVATLDRFAAESVGRYLSQMEREGAGLAEIESVLRLMVADIDTEMGPYGCLICNTTRETIVADAEVGGCVERYFQRIEGAFVNAISGERRHLDKSEDPVADLARWMTGVLIGVCVLARSPTSRKLQESFVENSLDHLRTRVEM